MPITLAKIASNTASVTLSGGSLGEDTVTLVYYPGRVTENVISRMSGFAGVSPDAIVSELHLFNETLASLIKSWDVFDDAEQTVMFPIDATRFSELPIAFRLQVTSGILGDIRPEAFAPQMSQTENSQH